MNTIDVINSEALKQRFTKDTKLPLNLYKNPYFRDRVHLYDKLYKNTVRKWESYLEMLGNFNSEQEYFEHYTQVKDGIINTIKNSSAYESFNSLDMNQFAVKERFRKFPSKSIFKPSFDGMEFVSVDMKKANFSSLHFFDASMFNNKDTWEEFVGQFTQYEHIINSKYIREAALGNCNPKRNITYERYLMSFFLEEFLDYGVSLDKDWESLVVFFSNDEVVFNVTDLSGGDRELLKSAVPVQTNIKGIDLHVNEFKLYYIPEIEGYILYDNDTREITPKSVNNFMMPILIRKMLGETVEPEDDELVFQHPNSGLLSRFIEIPEFDLPKELMIHEEID